MYEMYSALLDSSICASYRPWPITYTISPRDYAPGLPRVPFSNGSSTSSDLASRSVNKMNVTEEKMSVAAEGFKKL
jgi:hypothetical protein